MGLERLVLIGIIVMMLLPSVGAKGEFDRIISLEFRNENIREYGSLINESLEEFLHIENLIVENPSLDGEAVVMVNESIGKKKLTIMKEVAKGFVDFSIGKWKRVALIHFDDDAFVDSGPTRDRGILHSKVDAYRSGGGSCISCAIYRGVDICLKNGLSDVLLISDGNSSMGNNAVINEALAAASVGVKIHTIYLGDEEDGGVLKKISDVSNGKFNRTTCNKSLKDVYRGISDSLGDTVLALDTSDSMDGELNLECIRYRRVCGAGCIINQIILIVSSLYVLAIVLTGFYIFFIQVSIEDRAMAKSMLVHLLFSMVIVSASPHIISTIFSVSSSLTSDILSLAPYDAKDPFIGASTFIFDVCKELASIIGGPVTSFLIDPWLIVEGILVILRIRYYIVLVLSVLFPVTMFLYSLTFTRGLGKFMLEQTMLWIFAQVAMAVVFAIVAVGINLADTSLTMVISESLKLIMGLTGLMMLMMAPIAFVRILGGFLKQK